MATNVIEEFVAFLGWEVDSEALKGFQKQVDSVAKTVKWFSGIVTAATGVITALTIATNRETAEQANLAKSVGLSASELDAWAGIVKGIGLNAENVVDLVEEMNNKIGEFKNLGEMTAVKESLTSLGLEFENIKRLAPEDQFNAIIDAALKLEDVQTAVSAVDMLLGGEANKVLGFLRSYNMSLDDILQRQRDINLLTEEGREGAIAFNTVWGQTMTVLDSLKAQFSGLLGEALAPFLNKFIDWVIANKDLIKINVKNWVEGFTKVLKAFWSIGKSVWDVVSDITEVFGGLGNTLKLIAIIFGSIKIATLLGALSALFATIKGATVLATLKTLLGGLASPVTLLAGLLIILGLAIEDLIVFFNGGESALGKLGEKFSDVLHEKVKPFFAELFGMSEEELDLAFLKGLDIAENTFNDLINLVGTLQDKGTQLVTIWLIAFTRFQTQVTSIFQNLINLGTDLTAKYVNAFVDFRDKVFGIFSGIRLVAAQSFNTISKLINDSFSRLAGIPGAIVDAFNNAVTKVKNIGSKIPVIGGLFNNQAVTPSPSPGGNIAPTLAPSAGAISNAITNQSNRANTNINNSINITQLPGESGESLAKRITKGIEESAARAALNNSSGVVY